MVYRLAVDAGCHLGNQERAVTGKVGAWG
jgi:hypothetical protein